MCRVPHALRSVVGAAGFYGRNDGDLGGVAEMAGLQVPARTTPSPFRSLPGKNMANCSSPYPERTQPGELSDNSSISLWFFAAGPTTANLRICASQTIYASSSRHGHSSPKARRACRIQAVLQVRPRTISRRNRLLRAPPHRFGFPHANHSAAQPESVIQIILFSKPQTYARLTHIPIPPRRAP